MISKMTLLVLGMITYVQAGSTCDVTITTYSDNTCSTVKTDTGGVFNNGIMNLKMDYSTQGSGDCYSPPGKSQAVEMFVCDPDRLIAAYLY